MSELIQEYVDSASQRLRVDRAAGVIRGVKLLGLTSRNGRRYSERALVESVGLSPSVEQVRHQLQERFAHMVAEEVRQALLDDDFYANQDPQVFGRAVVGAVNDAVGYFLTHPGADAESLAGSLSRIFAP